MDESEKYQQRLQAIAEKRRMQELEEKARKETEEEWLKLAQHKRKSLREQWLMEGTCSSTEDPIPQSKIPTPQTTKQNAEEAKSSERLTKKTMEKTETMNEESFQTSYEPSITERAVQVCLGEEEEKVPEVIEVNVERNLLSKAAQEDTEEKRKEKTEDQVVDHLAMHALEPVDLLHDSLQQNRSSDEAHFSLADRNVELIMAEGDAELEDEGWEMVNCSPEESLGLMLISDLTQAQTDSGLSHKGDEAFLKVEQVFIMDEEEDIEIGSHEVLSFAVAAKKSDLEDTSCESWRDRNREEKPPEGVLQTVCSEKAAQAGTSALSNVSGIFSENPSVYLVKCTQSPPNPPLQTTQIQMVSQSTEQELGVPIIKPSSVTPNRAETVTLTKRKTCHCCTVM